jgi:hypothetical protein
MQELRVKERPMSPRLLATVWAVALGVVVVAAFAVATVGAPTSHAADPFVAGGRSTGVVTTRPSDLAPALHRADEVAAALGLPGGRRVAARVADAFDHRTFDEVTTVDVLGRDVAVTRFDPDGRVAMAVALGWHASRSAVAGADIVRRAGGFARAAGLAPTGNPVVQASAGGGGWSITWPRVVNGVPVRGDGLRVLVYGDGTFHGLTRTERPLAATPRTRVARGAAVSAAWQAVRGRVGDAITGARWPAWS